MSSKFNRKLKSYLTLYKPPIPPNGLDPMIFYFPDDGSLPHLHPRVQTQILRAVDQIVGGQPARIVRVILVGDVVNNKNRTADIKVLVQLNKQIMDVDVDGIAAESILNLCNQMSNSIALGTQRLIRYIPMVRSIDTKDYNALYDVIGTQWLKEPRKLN